MVKKALFILTILKIDEHNKARRVFTMRATEFRRNIDVCSENRFKSPTFDILNENTKIGMTMLNTVMNMINGTVPLYSKRSWSKYAWAQV